MSEQDDRAAAFYDDPNNLRIAEGDVVAPTGRRLSSHVPVRFDPVTIASVRQFANEDGQTVSSWIRHVVDREVQRRMSRQSQTGHKWQAVIRIARSIGINEAPASVSADPQASEAFASEARR